MTTAAAPQVSSEQTPPTGTAGPAWLRRLPRYAWSGTAGAVVMASSAFTPSLLPRGWALQGLVAGVAAATGYGFGVLVAWFVRAVTDWQPTPRVRRRAWQVLGVVGGACWACSRCGRAGRPRCASTS